jgi:hypothetical protein
MGSASAPFSKARRKIPGLRWAPAVAIIFLFVAFIVFHLVGCVVASAGAKTKFIDVNLYERLILDGISGYIPSIVDKRFGHSKHLRKRNQSFPGQTERFTGSMESDGMSWS